MFAKIRLGGSSRLALILLCLVLGAGLRWFALPDLHSPATDEDEPGYVSDGLLLIEGLPPGHRFAPSAPIAWFGAIYAGAGSVGLWLGHDPEIEKFPALLRPAASLEVMLFRLYADLSTLRLVIATCVCLLSLAAIWAIARFGYRMAGSAGAVASGVLAAAVPIVVDMSVQSRPYGIAWSCALLSVAATTTLAERRRAVLTGVFLGMAMSSRIDMVMIAPVVFACLTIERRWAADLVRQMGLAAAAALIAFLILAPWYLLHLVDNVRTILTVRLMTEGGGLAAAWSSFFDNGIALPLLVAIVGLGAGAMRRDWGVRLCGLWLLVLIAMGLRSDRFGLRHDGALIVAAIATLPLALRALARVLPAAWGDRATLAIAALACAPALWFGGEETADLALSRAPDPAVAWIEQNVPSGTRVFAEGLDFVALLPTEAASRRLWDEVAAPDAWVPKWTHDTAKFGYGGFRPLRVLSEDRMGLDRANRRRYDILGAPVATGLPRYDLWIVSGGSYFDVHPADVPARLCRDGGVYLHRGDPLPQLPPPAISWEAADGGETFIYRVGAGACAP